MTPACSGEGLSFKGRPLEVMHRPASIVRKRQLFFFIENIFMLSKEEYNQRFLPLLEEINSTLCYFPSAWSNPFEP